MKRLLCAVAAALILIMCAAAESPPFSGSPTLTLGEPQFMIDLGDESVVYLPLDELGRAQGVSALIGPTVTEPRHGVGGIRPSGWEQASYALVPGLSLYNRSHLLAHQLGGAEIPENIITGTQYLNMNGMGPVEDFVASYVASGGTVRYEVVPYYVGNELVCRGVFISAQSVGSDTVRVFEYCYNVQPGIAIDYATGQSRIADTEFTPDGPDARTVPGAAQPEEPTPEPRPVVTYVLNTNSRRFHLPTCSSVPDIKPENRRDFYGTREELIDMNYVPCGRCHP